MNQKYTLTEQVEILKSRGREYLSRSERRIKRLEETVFRNPPPIDPKTRLKPIALLVRVDRLEAAMKWWKRA